MISWRSQKQRHESIHKLRVGAITWYTSVTCMSAKKADLRGESGEDTNRRGDRHGTVVDYAKRLVVRKSFYLLVHRAMV